MIASTSTLKRDYSVRRHLRRYDLTGDDRI
jgi:hypothetical protein